MHALVTCICPACRVIVALDYLCACLLGGLLMTRRDAAAQLACMENIFDSLLGLVLVVGLYQQ